MLEVVPFTRLQEEIFATLKERKGKFHTRRPTMADAIAIESSTRAKAGHMANSTRLVTALKHEILEWEKA